jgi:hypothetical protein
VYESSQRYNFEINSQHIMFKSLSVFLVFIRRVIPANTISGL